MSDTYYSLTYHLIFGVYNRLSLITPVLRPRLHAYIASILKSHQQVPIKVGGVGDHVHILFGSRPTTCLPDLVRDIKVSASKWVNDNHLCLGKFQWQSGYGIFTVSRSLQPKVIEYILNQEQHHAIYGFSQEFKRMLDLCGIPYIEKYLPFEPHD